MVLGVTSPKREVEVMAELTPNDGCWTKAVAVATAAARTVNENFIFARYASKVIRMIIREIME